MAARAGDALSVHPTQPVARRTAPRNDRRRRNVQKRPEHECPLVHTRMRQRQLSLPQTAMTE
jgi:hypothetical protein